jgi:hypothetical protein
MNSETFPPRNLRRGHDIQAIDAIRTAGPGRFFLEAPCAKAGDLFELLARILSAVAAHNNERKKIGGYR